MKLNGVELIPSSLVACFVNGIEVRILQLAYEGFSFRMAERVEKLENLTLQYFQFSESSYQTVEIRDYCIEIEETDFYVIYTIRTEQNDYKMHTDAIIKDYSNYISLKLSGDDAYLSQQMVNYPAEADEEYYDTWEEQKKEFFLPLQYISYQVSEQYEFALSLDSPMRYQKYLAMDIKQFKQEYLKENYLEDHPLLQRKVTRLYVGNQFCHNLQPTKEQYFAMLQKAQIEDLSLTLVFTYLRDEFVEQTDTLLQMLYDWCKTENKVMEIVVNDWGMVKLLEDKQDYFQLNLGILLNKRRKDPRYSYKQGFPENVDKLSENNLSSGNYRKYLLEKWNISRYEYESCGYPIKIPTAHNSLHLPYYQTNTSQYCTLYARCSTGRRGKQTLAENCPYYCDEIAFMYPKHLKMIGKYNSLFAYDDSILKDSKQLNGYLQHGTDRIVLNLL